MKEPNIELLIQIIFVLVVGLIFAVTKIKELFKARPQRDYDSLDSFDIEDKKELKQGIEEPLREGIGLEDDIDVSEYYPTEQKKNRIKLDRENLQEGIKWAIVLNKPRALRRWDPSKREI